MVSPLWSNRVLRSPVSRKVKNSFTKRTVPFKGRGVDPRGTVRGFYGRTASGYRRTTDLGSQR